VRDGRFGPYIQLGEVANGTKPKRASIPKGTEPATLEFDTALKLLALPREIGTHPESGEPILAGIGRFGPYVKHQKDYASLEDGDDALTVGINRAVVLLAEKKARGGKGGFRRGRPAGKVLGEHPAGGEVTQHEGRYGPYVSYNKINATITSNYDPAAITLDEALVLIADRAEKIGAKPPKAKKAKAAKKKNGNGEHKKRKTKAAAEASAERGEPKKPAPKKRKQKSEPPAETDKA
jgi:DNA topoisomerase-1